MPTEENLSTNALYEKLVQVIQSSANKNKEEITEKIQTENEKILNLLNEQNEKVQDLEERYKLLEDKYVKLDRQLRKNNVLIFGLNQTNNSGFEESVLTRINQLLNTDFSLLDCNNIYPIKSQKTNPIKIEFISHLRKQLIFKNIHKLKGKGIFIANDLSYEDREDRKILIANLKEAKEKQLSAKIIGHKLVVNGDTYTAKQLIENNPEIVHFKQGQTDLQISEAKSDSAPSSPTILERNSARDTEGESPTAPPTKKQKTTVQTKVTQKVPELRPRTNTKSKFNF